MKFRNYIIKSKIVLKIIYISITTMFYKQLIVILLVIIFINSKPAKDKD
jgi:hypothetical protein